MECNGVIIAPQSVLQYTGVVQDLEIDCGFGESGDLRAVYGFIPVGLLGLNEITLQYLLSPEYIALTQVIEPPQDNPTNAEWYKYSQQFVDARNLYAQTHPSVVLSEDQLRHIVPVVRDLI